jgi:hypothetical protein
MPLERSDVEAALEKKGFLRAKGDHRFFTYYMIAGAKTSVWTKTSHGTGYKLSAIISSATWLSNAALRHPNLSS